MMKLACLVLLSLLFASAVAKNHVLLGGWSPIKNLNDPRVSGIANYAVTEHNKRSGENLKLQKLIKGESEVVGGVNYRLTFTATEGSSSDEYQAIVLEKPWLHFKNLTSFTRVHA
ncbi:hypothetical protein Fmac_013697 [Flemingia macrophylla]|uniref:Cystatin domain-containing protein n=1 Tax=Flemingia macrophylla TaxID=520843 RepID=A0ABD1MTV2_9FABA